MSVKVHEPEPDEKAESKRSYALENAKAHDGSPCEGAGMRIGLMSSGQGAQGESAGDAKARPNSWRKRQMNTEIVGAKGPVSESAHTKMVKAPRECESALWRKRQDTMSESAHEDAKARRQGESADEEVIVKCRITAKTMPQSHVLKHTS